MFNFRTADIPSYPSLPGYNRTGTAAAAHKPAHQKTQQAPVANPFTFEFSKFGGDAPVLTRFGPSEPRTPAKDGKPGKAPPWNTFKFGVHPVDPPPPPPEPMVHDDGFNPEWAKIPELHPNNPLYPICMRLATPRKNPMPPLPSELPPTPLYPPLPEAPLDTDFDKWNPLRTPNRRNVNLLELQETPIPISAIKMPRETFEPPPERPYFADFAKKSAFDTNAKPLNEANLKPQPRMQAPPVIVEVYNHQDFTGAGPRNPIKIEPVTVEQVNRPAPYTGPPTEPRTPRMHAQFPMSPAPSSRPKPKPTFKIYAPPPPVVVEHIPQEDFWETKTGKAVYIGGRLLRLGILATASLTLDAINVPFVLSEWGAKEVKKALGMPENDKGEASISSAHAGQGVRHTSSAYGAGKAARFNPLGKRRRRNHEDESAPDLVANSHGATPGPRHAPVTFFDATPKPRRNRTAAEWDAFHETPRSHRQGVDVATARKQSRRLAFEQTKTPTFEFRTPKPEVPAKMTEEDVKANKVLFKQSQQAKKFVEWIEFMHSHNIALTVLRDQFNKKLEFPTETIIKLWLKREKDPESWRLFVDILADKEFREKLNLNIPEYPFPPPKKWDHEDLTGISGNSVRQQKDGCCRFCRGQEWAGETAIRYRREKGEVPSESWHKSAKPYTDEELEEFGRRNFDSLHRRWCRESRYDWIFVEPHFRMFERKFSWMLAQDDPRLRHFGHINIEKKTYNPQTRICYEETAVEMKALRKELARHDIAAKMLIDAMKHKDKEYAADLARMNLERKRRQVRTDWLCVKQVRVRTSSIEAFVLEQANKVLQPATQTSTNKGKHARIEEVEDESELHRSGKRARFEDVIDETMRPVAREQQKTALSEKQKGKRRATAEEPQVEPEIQRRFKRSKDDNTAPDAPRPAALKSAPPPLDLVTPKKVHYGADDELSPGAQYSRIRPRRSRKGILKKQTSYPTPPDQRNGWAPIEALQGEPNVASSRQVVPMDVFFSPRRGHVVGGHQERQPRGVAFAMPGGK